MGIHNFFLITTDFKIEMCKTWIMAPRQVLCKHCVYFARQAFLKVGKFEKNRNHRNIVLAN